MDYPLHKRRYSLTSLVFFQGEDRDFASKIWESSKLYGETNIRDLLDKCLITIAHNRIYIHGLIEKMCKKIVQEQHPKDPSKWSRLWNSDDIYCTFESEEVRINYLNSIAYLSSFGR